MWINSCICGSKQGVTNLSHAQMIFVKFWNVSAALKSQIPLLSGLNHRLNTVLLDRIAAARKADVGRDRHCEVINDVPFSLYFTLMMPKWDTCIYFTVVSQSEARVATEHGIKQAIEHNTKGRKLELFFRLWTHKKHPIYRPYRWAMGRLFDP